MMGGSSGAALALSALTLFAFRAGGLLLAGRLGPHSPWLAWASSVSYALLAVYRGARQRAQSATLRQRQQSTEDDEAPYVSIPCAVFVEY